MRQVTMDKFGNVLEVIDQRIFEDTVQFRLAYIREQAMLTILAAIPEYKQRNAALGLLSDTETQNIKDTIAQIRDSSNQREAEIHAVIWDGQESTRSAACDAVESVNW